MPKAIIRRRSGIRIMVEGSNEEVQEILTKLEGRSSKGERDIGDIEFKSHGGNALVKDLILELKASGFFSDPRSLSDFKTSLAAEGHFVPITTLSGVMIGLVKAKYLRRTKEGRFWRYSER